MAFSRVILNYEGSDTFAVNFTLGYLSPDHVTARVNEEVDGTGAPLYRTLTWLTSGTVQVAGDFETDDVVTFERTTPRDLLINSYLDGDIIDDVNLDESFKQSVMLAHEVLDGRFGVIGDDINMGGNRLTNMADAVDDQDAVTLTQLRDYTGDAPGHAADAAASALLALGYKQDVRADTLIVTANTAATLLARNAAEGYAAALNLPGIVSGSAGKFLQVNDAESGYELDVPVATLTALSIVDGSLLHTTGDGAYDADNYFYVEFQTFGPTFSIDANGHLIATRLGD